MVISNLKSIDPKDYKAVAADSTKKQERLNSRKKVSSKNLKVALVMPPSPYLANDVAYPPMGLLYIAAAMRKWRPQHSVEIIELGGKTDWRERAKRIDADVVGIQCVTPNHEIVREICSLVPAKSFTVVGGIHPTYVPDAVLDDIPCDIVLRGEGELEFLKIMDEIVDGTYRRFYEAEPIQDIDELPMPAIDMVNITRYRPGGDKAMTIYTSRGCIYKCTFCSMIMGKTFRMHSVERVVAEVKRAREYGIDHIVFGDDNVGIDMKRLAVLLEAMKRLDVTFRLNMSVGFMTEDVATAAREAGCTDISYGVETFSATMLRKMKKPATRDMNIDAIKMTQRFDMRAKVYLMVNYPGEDEKTVCENLDGLAEARPDRWLLSAFVPLPGSPSYHQPDKFGIKRISKKWQDFYLVGNNASFAPCFETDELTYDRQKYLHDVLLVGCKQVLGS